MKNLDSVYDGVLSSFFIQPERPKLRTTHYLNDSVSIGTNQQDWAKIAGDFNRASDKVIDTLKPTERKRLNKVRYQYESKKP